MRCKLYLCKSCNGIKVCVNDKFVGTEKKGGELASAVHSYMQHGDPMIRSLVQHTLAVVSLLTLS